MYKVYWTENNQPDSRDFESLTEALEYSSYLRTANHRFVTMVSENVNCTSKPGVDTVKDVANYDGWISRGRAP